jgi:hypothetical protein
MLYTQQEAALQKALNPAKAAQAGPLNYYGGQVIGSVKVYAVMWGPNVKSSTVKDIGDYFAAITNSTQFDFLKEYNTNKVAMDGRQGTNQTINRGKFMQLYTITPTNTATALKDSEVAAELEAQIAAGNLPKNDDDSLYMTYFPPGVSIAFDDGSGASCQAFCAYHEFHVSQTAGNLFYGVMPDLGGACAFGCGFHANPFDSLSIISAHELIEATTDPFPTPGSTPAYPQAWNDAQGSEIGDLCAFTENHLTTQGQTYLIQGEFDNATRACTVGPYQSP